MMEPGFDIFELNHLKKNKKNNPGDSKFCLYFLLDVDCKMLTIHDCTCQCPWLPARWDCWREGQSGGLVRSSPWGPNEGGPRWTTTQDTWTRTGPWATEGVGCGVGATRDKDTLKCWSKTLSACLWSGVCIWSLIICTFGCFHAGILCLDEVKL